MNEEELEMECESAEENNKNSLAVDLHSRTRKLQLVLIQNIQKVKRILVYIFVCTMIVYSDQSHCSI